MDLPNRVAMAPMGVEIVSSDGKVNEPLIAYYEERARGGVGLIITEVCAVSYPRGANSAHQLGLSDDSFIDGMCQLTERVNRHGTRIAVQLVHHGKVSRQDTKEGRSVLVASEPVWGGHMDMIEDLSPEELGWLMEASGGFPNYRSATIADLQQVVDDFAEATRRARDAGFDGVEIHGAHGYLISGFLSRQWNTRTDEYGGSVENRARMLCDVLTAAKDRAGEDFPIWCRLDALEYRTPHGIEFDDTLHVAELAVDAGSDAIHVSAYADMSSGAGFTEGPLIHEPGALTDYARTVKQLIPVPVIAVGRITPEAGESLIADGGADVVAMGRQLLADPALVAKLAAGRHREVRPCIYCYVCVAQPFFDRQVRCTVNPQLARESEIDDPERAPRAKSAQRVLVVGGGPGGMEAARVAALRGHDVTLFEKSGQLGGALRFAALVYEPNELLLDWLELSVAEAGVDVRLHEALDPAEAKSFGADRVIVATGAARVRPDVTGIDLVHVFDGDDLREMLTGEGDTGAVKRLSLTGRVAARFGRATGMTSSPSRLRDLSHAYLPLGDHVVVLGGGLVGIELAAFLAQRQRSVTVLEEGDTLAIEMAHPRRWRELYELREAGATLHTGAAVTEVTPDEVRFTTGDEAATVHADNVIVATGLTADESVADSFRAAGIEPIVVGDCSGVAYIEGAMREGFHAGWSLGELEDGHVAVRQ